MSTLWNYFKKSGGVKILRQYWNAGVLFSAIIQFVLLGRSKTALLLLREIVSLKTQNKLCRKYNNVLEQFDGNYKEKSHTRSKKIWIFWWQGIENAPEIVQICYNSVKENLADWEIILVTEKNYSEYANFPSYIIQKLQKGQITLTHFSDLLRLELLINHGGLWLDSTVLCTSASIPISIINSDLFVYQILKPGADGHATIMSSWCMYAKTNNKILMATRELLYEYWKKRTSLVDYFLLHQFFSIVCEHYPEEAKKIPPFSSSIPHILLLHLFDEYNEQYWTDLKRMACFHKLTYKLEGMETDKMGTYYDMIIKKRQENGI